MVSGATCQSASCVMSMTGSRFSADCKSKHCRLNFLPELYWQNEEEEDDDMDFLFDEDEAEAMTYNHLLQAESSRRRRRSDAPPKVIRQRDLPSGHRRIKADYFVADPVYNDKQFRRR